MGLSLSSRLQEMSSKLKINRGAEGPAALVASEQQRAEIAAFKDVLDGYNKASVSASAGPFTSDLSSTQDDGTYSISGASSHDPIFGF